MAKYLIGVAREYQTGKKSNSVTDEERRIIGFYIFDTVDLKEVYYPKIELEKELNIARQDIQESGLHVKTFSVENIKFKDGEVVQSTYGFDKYRTTITNGVKSITRDKNILIVIDSIGKNFSVISVTAEKTEFIEEMKPSQITKLVKTLGFSVMNEMPHYHNKSVKDRALVDAVSCEIEIDKKIEDYYCKAELLGRRLFDMVNCGGKYIATIDLDYLEDKTNWTKKLDILIPDGVAELRIDGKRGGITKHINQLVIPASVTEIHGSLYGGMIDNIVWNLGEHGVTIKRSHFLQKVSCTNLTINTVRNKLSRNMFAKLSIHQQIKINKSLDGISNNSIILREIAASMEKSSLKVLESNQLELQYPYYFKLPADIVHIKHAAIKEDRLNGHPEISHARLLELPKTLKEIDYAGINMRINKLLIKHPVELHYNKVTGPFAGSKIKELEIASGSVVIPPHAFDGTGIEKLILGNHVEKIEKYAFAKCELEEVVIPESVRHIESGAFNRNKLKQVKFIGDMSKVKIDNGAFANNPELKFI